MPDGDEIDMAMSASSTTAGSSDTPWGCITQVVLVEEAAEVMEIHILTSLAPSIEHAILIGDHEQLRPKTQLWEMQVSFTSHALKQHYSVRLFSMS